MSLKPLGDSSALYEATANGWIGPAFYPATAKSRAFEV